MKLLLDTHFSLDVDVRSWVARALSIASTTEAPLTNAVVLATRDIELPHRDPADAFIVATAKCFR